MSTKIISLVIVYEQDAVLARQRTRQISDLLGFDLREQTAISTVVSEIVRNAFNYAGGGTVEFSLDEKNTSRQIFIIKIHDNGPGIPNLNDILEGKYKSTTGMGVGIVGSRKMMDYFNIESSTQSGTTVILGKYLPKEKPPVTLKDIADITKVLSQKDPYNVYEEIQSQNQDLLRTLEELKKRQDDLVRLNKELEDTNRGVVALYAELDERAEHLKQVNDIKARFLSNMSHEFRTPLSSITGLARILLDRIDGDLSEEQEKQIKYIKKSADDLMEIVNDLLDIAKVEAGKLDVKPGEFTIDQLFATLRSMFKPLLINTDVQIIYEEPGEIPVLFTDEKKVAQILRNFISNAVKFTERGEIRIKAKPEENSIVFSVSDTGIGIPEEFHEIIFEEFTQVESELQHKTKGTGLGLPLSKKLALLLGGNIWFESNPGKGSIFYLRFPVKFIEEKQLKEEETDNVVTVIEQYNSELPVLIVEDSEEINFMYEVFLKDSGFNPIFAKSIKEAKNYLSLQKPFIIILDILLIGENSWDFLTWLKSDDLYKNIPVIIASILEEEMRGFALGVDDYWVKPLDKSVILKSLNEIKSKTIRKILIIDDEEVSRYLLRNMLNGYSVLEAADGETGFSLAVENKPDAIFLDLVMPEKSGFEILDMLKSNNATSDIPVFIFTSKHLNKKEIEYLNKSVLRIFSKSDLTGHDTILNIRKLLSMSFTNDKEAL